MLDFEKTALFIVAALLIVMGFFGQTDSYKNWMIKQAKKWVPYDVNEKKQMRLLNFQAKYLFVMGIVVLLLAFIF
ncbi:hypothetical protein KDA10_02110 [candidate division WWE3 bacterium]|uniref:Uncharacterized protein n=1 Tax=candidate division WWE3 bacterium TaxID=2053526 RepID=A0A955E242_UNCKA|nr:hypothetical protein [candidate division WWE3 bacterium]MCB9827745.1 hypothetical protein [Candidatus Nomurabacteria bacterium]